MKNIIVILVLFIVSPAFGAVPEGYVVRLESGFNSTTTFTCPDSGDGCIECDDKNTRVLEGVDSITGYDWDDLELDPAEPPRFIDVIDSCTQGVDDLEDFHTIEIVSSGVTQYGGGTGAALKGVLVSDGSSESYSRIGQAIYDRVFVSDNLDNWEDLANLYFEIDLQITNPSLMTTGHWLSLFEMWLDDGNHKISLLLSCTGTACTDSPAGPKFYMKNGPNIGYKDNDITVEAGKPFRLRIWYTASQTNGTFKATYQCPTCTMSDETTIKEWTGVDTMGSSSYPTHVRVIKAAGMWENIEVYWTNFLIASENTKNWVRHNLSTGENDGSSYDNAWRGLDNVAWGTSDFEVGAGDTLYVCGGPYDDTLIIGANGTSSDPITIRGDCSDVYSSYTDGVIGRVSLTNFLGVGQGISIYNDEWIIIRDLAFVDPLGGRRSGYFWAGKFSSTGNADATHATVMTDNEANMFVNEHLGNYVMNTTTGYYAEVESNTETTITVGSITGGWTNGDGYVAYADNASIRMSGTTNNIVIDSCTFEQADLETGFAIGGWLGTGSDVHDITISNNAFSGTGDKAIYFYIEDDPRGSLYNLTIRNNVMTNGFNFLSTSTLWAISANRSGYDVDQDGTDNDDFAPYGFVVEDNIIHLGAGGHNYLLFGAGMHEVAGEGYNSVKGNTMTNTGTQSDYSNMIQTFHSKDLIIENNTIQGPYILDHCDGNAIILDWMISDYADAIQETYASDRVTIRNNYIYDASSEPNCTGKGIGVWRGTNIEIYNNLIVNCDLGIKVDSGPDRTNPSTGVSIWNNTIINSKIDGIFLPTTQQDVVIVKNNIISGSIDDGIDVNYGSSAIDEDHNLIFNSGGSDCEGFSCDGTDILDEDPRLDANSEIDWSSPAYDTGVDVGISFCGDNPDIGFYETCYSWTRYNLQTGDNDGRSYANAWRIFDNIEWDDLGNENTLYICDGIYDDALIIKASGSVDNPIIIDGNCSGVDASYTDGTMGRVSLENATSSTMQSISVWNDSYITIQNLTFKNPLGVREKDKQSTSSGQYTGSDSEQYIMVNTSNNDLCESVDTPWDCCTGLETGNCTTANWAIDSLIGGIVFNTSGGSRGIIIDNDNTSITVAEMLGGGMIWNTGDWYSVSRDYSSIQLGGISNNIIIEKNIFYLDDGDIGYGIHGYLSANAEIHDILIKDNSFIGGDESAIFFYTQIVSPVGIFYNITAKNNVLADGYQFFYMRTLSELQPYIDPDGDGDDDDDLFPYGYDIIGNIATIKDGGFRFITLSGAHAAPGDEHNYIRNNYVVNLGTQIGYANTFQINFAKDLIIENNTIIGPHLTQLCDGAAIIIDWHWKDSNYICDGVIIRNNHIINADSEGDCIGKGISIYRGSNTQVYNNLITGSDIGIKVASSTTAGNTSIGTKIWNNTVINSTTDGIFIEASTPEVIVRNNIVKSSGDDGIDDNSTNIDEDYNLIYLSTSNDCEGFVCGDQTIQLQDPLLNSDYEITTSSPAYNTGIDVGLEYCYGIPDMGFYEICVKAASAININ